MWQRVLNVGSVLNSAVKDTDMVKDDTFEKNQKATKSKEIWQDVPLPDDRLGIQRGMSFSFVAVCSVEMFISVRKREPRDSNMQ